ncbi:MAG: tagatose 1,6-diphosphate aldolase [Chloroflexota bacterium]
MTDRALGPGKARGLATASTAEGVFTILAIDHRDSLRVVLRPDDPQGVAPSAITALKLDLLRGLADRASAVMLEPEYSAAQAILTRSLPGSVGFLAAVEAQGYLGDPEATRTTLLEGWGVEKAKRLGASGIKLLVLYRPDSGPVAEAQEQTVDEVIADCARYDTPLFLEPLLYERPGIGDDRRALVVETVRRLGRLGPDILKVQFPLDIGLVDDRAVWREACAELDSVAPVPWALLSGGGSFERFREQLAVACDAGASGFMVGRALWGEYVTAPRDQQPELMQTVLQPRFEELAAIAVRDGRAWWTRQALPRVDEQWYRTY